MFSRAFWVSCLLGFLCALAHSKDLSKDVESNLEQAGGGNLMLVEESKLEEKKITRRASEDKIESTNNESVELIKKKISEEKKPSKRALSAPRVPVYGGVYGNQLGGYNNEYFPPYSNNVGNVGYGGAYANPYASYANYASYGYGAGYGGGYGYGGQNIPTGYYGTAAYGANRGGVLGAPKSPLIYGGIPINNAMTGGGYASSYDQGNVGPSRNDDAYAVNNAGGYGGQNAGYAVSYNGVNSGVQNGLYSGAYLGGYGQTIPQYGNGIAGGISGDYGDAYGGVHSGAQVANYNLGHSAGINAGQGLPQDAAPYGAQYGDSQSNGDQISATTGHSGLANEAPIAHTIAPGVVGNHGGSEGALHAGNTEGYGPISGSYKGLHNLGGDKEKGSHNGGELLSKGAYLNARGKGLMDKFLSSFILRVPVPVEVPKYYPVHIPKPFPVKVIKPVPYPVYKNIPYPVQVPSSQQGPYSSHNNPHAPLHNIYGGQGGNVGK